MSIYSTRTKSTRTQTPEPAELADIIQQLRRFFYSYNDIRDAMDNVNDPTDINAIMDYIDSKSDDDLDDLYMTKAEHVVSLTQTNRNKHNYINSNIWNENTFNFHDKNGTRVNILYLLNCGTLNDESVRG
eukprot:240299_1